MHQIMLRDLKFLRYWWSCLTCVTFCWFALHETLILLSCCVFIEMVNCLNTIILKSFVIVFTSILHLFYQHDHQYRRNFKSLNIIWCIVCFSCIYWDAWFFFLSRNTSSVLHSMLNAKHFEIVYVLHHLYVMHSNVKTPVTLCNYQPVAWVLYQRVIDQSKADIFINPGIIDIE
jgi:amino acid transporter